ncbi:NAD(P)-dependent oxidoreductase [Psychromonas sp. psych-6C06]|uniref:DUF2867 domain-containing protein n=1 Tax=Psychromonas sp. psych-6C06 TaxID=2058089 RepID=UPI000C338A4F|nr:DUF2867 domain-containing protein [Psychromonas sp. psych-6C06]PKF63526.1 NAD(P)-dependent oxidoreductase [Psychromonas sp. psych-6C06]
MVKHILVLGASGYIGSQLVPLLAQKGHHVTATGRNVKQLEKQPWSKNKNIDIIQLTLSSDTDLTETLKGVDVVYFLVHGMSHGHDFVNVELNIAKNFSQYLKKSTVKQLIYLGSLQPTKAHSEHFIARKQTGDILRSSQTTVIELRAGIIVGPGSAAFEVMRDFVFHLPLLITPKWINSHNSPIALENILYYLTELLSFTPQEHQIMDVAGPKLMTYQQQIQVIAKLTKQKVIIVPLSLLTPKIASYWFKIITSVPTNIAKALVSGLQYDLTANAKQLQDLIPQKLLSFEEAVSNTLKNEINIIDTQTWGVDGDARSRWQPSYGYYAKQAGYTLKTEISSASLWQQIQLIGTEQGYFFANILWRIRELMDCAVGGDALKRYRRHPKTLSLGDTIDSWKVIALKEQHVLSLLLGMKAPGLGRLEFIIEDKGDYRLLDIRAWWHPAGFSGLLYWYALMPAHLFIFKGMAKAIQKKCRHNKTQIN